MRSSIAALSIAVLAVLLFSGLSTGVQSPAQDHRNVIPSAATGVVSTGNASGQAAGSEQVFVLLTLSYRNQGELSNFLSEVQNPASPLYHRYLNRSQFDQIFAPSAAEYYGYASYLQSTGLHVSTYSGRTSIGLHGTLSQYESVFHTVISTFHDGKRPFHAPVTQPWLSYGSTGQIAGITGLSNQYVPVLSPMFVGSGSSQALYGADMQAAYQLNSLYQSKGYPANETIATILWSGNNSTGASVAPFVPSDITYYFNHNFPAGEPKPNIYGYPVGGAPVPGSSAATDSTQANYESTLDLEMAGSTAPGASVVEVYGPQPTMAYLDLALQSVLTPSYNTTVNNALSHVVAISNSWGGGDGTDSTWSSLEQEAAARGITVLASSGDNGNTVSASPSFPATVGYNTYGTLAVGGAAMQLNGQASNDGSGTTGISTQSVWYNTPSSGDGSQGGVSSYYSEPSWQANSADANSVISAVASGRGTPDVAGDGANMYIYLSTTSGPGYVELWGTSVASPLLAGEIAAMDYYLGPPEGFINPLVYRLGQAEVNGSYASARPLYFISNGSNALYPGQNGYSLAVGWGSINALNFIEAQTAVLNYTVKFTETGLPAGTLWYVNVTGIGNFQSTNTTLTFSASNGQYAYTLASQNSLYSSSSGGGTINIAGSPVSINVAFSRPYNVTFSETGLPNAYSWYLNISGHQSSGAIAAGANYTALLKNGTYLYSAGSTNNTYAAPQAVVIVSGADQAVTVTYSILKFGIHFLANYSLSSTLTWYLNLSNGQKFSTVTREISFSEQNGTYQFTVASGNSTFRPSASSGTLKVQGKTITETINFSPVTYMVNFSETGLRQGLSWSISISGTGNTNVTENTTLARMEFNLTNGTYRYTLHSMNRTYAPGTSSGTFAVNGSGENFTMPFHTVMYSATFNETGLPSGSKWSIEFSSGTVFSSTKPGMSIQLANGSYSYSVISANRSWKPASHTGSISIDGPGTQVSIKFSIVTYVLKFVEKGLPTGTKWDISVGTHSYVVNGTSISLVFANGTVPYAVSGIANYKIFNRTGNVSIDGHGATVTVTFSRQTGTTTPLTYSVLVLVLGAIVVVAFAYGAYNRRKK